jgi:colanic acid/amylovoran biosynthesis glycosyltransferase
MTTPPRLLYVTSRFPFGSSETFLVPEVRGLLETFDVTVVPMHPHGRLLHPDSRAVLSITVARSLASPYVIAFALLEFIRSPLKVLRVLAKVLRHSRCARVLGRNLVVFPKGLWLSRFARLRGAQHIHAHWASASATMAYVASEVSGTPWSLTAHRWDIGENNLLAVKASSSAFLRAISERGAAQIRDLSGTQARRVSVVHLGVALPAGSAQFPRPEPFRVLVAANLKEVKGHCFLLEAVAILARRGISVHLDVAGSGPLRFDLESQADRLHIRPFVSFLGLIPHAALLDALQAGRWHTVALPSIRTLSGDEEGVPVALMEAMACGIPVVATQTGAISELVLPGTGILVPDKSSAALADALQQLCREPKAAREMGIRGAHAVRASFSAEACSSALAQLIAQHCLPCEVHPASTRRDAVP